MIYRYDIGFKDLIRIVSCARGSGRMAHDAREQNKTDGLH
jgi:hypothetical protein